MTKRAADEGSGADRPDDRWATLRERLVARYPLLVVVYDDGHECNARVEALGRAAGLAVLRPPLTAEPPDGAARAAVEALSDSSPPTLLVLDAGHDLLASPPFVRVLREHLTTIERCGHVVALLAPVEPHCPELDHDRVTVRVPLPDGETLRPLLAAAFANPAGQAPTAPTLEAAIRAAQGLTTAQVRRSLRRVRSLAATDPKRALDVLRREKQALIAATGVLEVVDDVPALDEVGGLDELKAWLLRRRRTFSPAARAFGLPPPRGLLIVGVQGCGKSLVAKSAAAVFGLPLVRLDVGRLYGQARAPDENLRRALSVAEASAPVVLWLDEVDKAFAGAMHSDAGARIFGSFITWLAEHPPGVFVAATANRVEHLPAEMLRKGRFDETFFVDLPDARVRAEILAIHLRRSGRDPAGFDIEALARASERLTGAELEQALIEALAMAWDAERKLSEDDIERALCDTVPFVETYEEQVRQLREWAHRRARPAARDRSLRELFDEAHTEAGER